MENIRNDRIDSLIHLDIIVLLQETQSTLLSTIEPSANISTIYQNLKDSGLEDKYIEVLLHLIIKNKAIAGLWELCGKQESFYNKKIKITVENYNHMMSNPSKFYTHHKGNKHFRKYGSLSLAYTNSSPINLIQKIVKDAEQISGFYTKDFENEMIDIYGDKEIISDIINIVAGNDVRDLTDNKLVPFQNISFQRLFEALEQDIFGIGLPHNILQEFKDFLHFEDLGKNKSYRSSNSQHDFLEGLFYYFSHIEDIKKFSQKREKNENGFKDSIKKDFQTKFYNEPNINPRLIEMTPHDLGTREFNKKREQRRNEQRGDKKRKDIVIDGENSDQFL